MQQLALAIWVVAVKREGGAAAESRHVVRGRAQGWGGLSRRASKEMQR